MLPRTAEPPIVTISSLEPTVNKVTFDMVITSVDIAIDEVKIVLSYDGIEVASSKIILIARNYVYLGGLVGVNALSTTNLNK